MPFILAALSGILQVLVFPRFSFYWLAAVAVAPLLFALAREESSKRRFLAGWLCGSIYWGGTCYWVYGVMNDYAGIPAAGAGAIYVAFLLAKGLHLGVFSLLAGPLMSRSWALPAISALWVAIEGTHQYFGFPWLYLGNAAASMSVLARLAPVAGVYGPSFLLMMLNTALALTLIRAPRIRLAWLAVIPLGLFLPALPDGEKGEVPVRLVQPNIHPDEVLGERWTADRAQQHLTRMLQLSISDPERPELLVWPEYSVPAYYFESAHSKAYLESVAKAVNSHFVFNTLEFVEIDGLRRPRNSAVTLGPQGELISRYSKVFLVPFGEFVPWPFSLIVEKITLAAGDFYPGEEFAVADIGDHKIGTYICYENAFGRGVRRFVANGAEALVNISNDSWYGRTSARYQHLLLARMRAIENQRWIVRSTNDGITTVINRAGQISPPLPSFEQGSLTAYFNYSDEMTGYARFGEWFWWVCIGLSSLALFRSRRVQSA